MMFDFRKVVHPAEPPRLLRACAARPVRPVVRGRGAPHGRRGRRHRGRRRRGLHHGLVAGEWHVDTEGLPDGPTGCDLCLDTIN